MHDPTILVISSVCLLLIISAFTFFISKYIKLPFTILLVIVGIIFSNLTEVGPEFFHPLAHYKMDPDLILFACLPTLIFESAFTMDARLLRRNLLPVMTLAIPGLFLSTTIIGLIVWLFTPLNFLVAILLGTILSATDPVAVISLFKKLGLPKRLTILVEGESLFNDSTAIVTAKTVLIIMLAGVITTSSLLHGVYEFCYEFFGGMVVGLVMTMITGFLLGFVEDEPLIGLSFTIILAYLSFLVAENVFHVSGVMATITAGIVMAGWGRTKMSKETENNLRSLLDFLTYIVNALIFLLVGFTINLTNYTNIYILFVVIVAMLFSRAIIVYGLIPIVGKLPNSEPIDLRYQTIMWWGGLRGAIAIAIVFSLVDLPDQDILESVVMGSVLFTIIVQGLSIGKLIHWLNLDKPLLFDRFIKIETELSAKQVALDRIPDLRKRGLISQKIAQSLQIAYAKSIKRRHEQLLILKNTEFDKNKERSLLFLNCFALEKALYYALYSKGYFSEQTYRILHQDMELEIDLMRDLGKTTVKVPSSHFKNISILWLKICNYLPGLNKIADSLRVAQIIRNYEETWGLHQGSVAVMKHLDQVEKKGTMEISIVQEVRDCFQSWLYTTSKHLAEVAEQFPEFINERESRLGRKVLLHAEQDLIIEEIHQGFIPYEVAKIILEKYEHQIRQLRQPPSKILAIHTQELLKKIAFIKQIPANDFENIIILFEVYHLAAGEFILRSDNSDNKLYCLVRGMVHVTNVRNIKAAELVAGNFFGEISSLKSMLIYQTSTPCIFYILNPQNLKKLQKDYPIIAEMIVQEVRKVNAAITSTIQI